MSRSNPLKCCSQCNSHRVAGIWVLRGAAAGAQNYSGPYVHGSGPPGGYDEEATAWAAYHEHFQARTGPPAAAERVAGGAGRTCKTWKCNAMTHCCKGCSAFYSGLRGVLRECSHAVCGVCWAEPASHHIVQMDLALLLLSMCNAFVVMSRNAVGVLPSKLPQSCYCRGPMASRLLFWGDTPLARNIIFATCRQQAHRADEEA